MKGLIVVCTAHELGIFRFSQLGGGVSVGVGQKVLLSFGLLFLKPLNKLN